MSSPCDPQYAPAGDVSAALMVIDSRLKALYDGRTEADPFKGKISDESPVGHALLGKAVGDEAEVLLPAGHTVIYKVLAITHSKV